MRKLPVYILIDTSGSMKGEPIESVNVGLQSMLSTLRNDPFALESVHICLITFDREVRCMVSMTPLENIILPTLNAPESGPTHTGAALRLLCDAVDKDVRKSTATAKGDWRPMLFLMTDGKPSDTQLYKDMIGEVKKRNFAAIVACAAGMHAKPEPLKLLTDKVYMLDTIDNATFTQFFAWVSTSIGMGNQSMGLTEEPELPPPPEEMFIA